MGFWDSVFGAVFGRRGSRPTSPPPPPPPRPPATPPAPPPPPPPRPPATPPAPPPATPPPPPPVTPPAPPVTPPAPPPPPPPPAGPPSGFTLDSLRAADATRLVDDAIAAGATQLGITDANVLKAILRVESGGPGFSGSKLLISFEPFYFSQATGGRFDASHPSISNQNRAPLGGNQAARWTKVAEAYALDPAAALGATSWGAFQLPGRYYATAGYPNVWAFVQDMAQSEARQLAAFVAYVTRGGLSDELQNRDWAAFAGEFEGGPGAAAYATALASAFAALPPLVNDGYLLSLRAGSNNALTQSDFETVAAELGCEVEAIKAVVQVESGRAGAFGADGRPIILFEPHIFSRRTNRRFDATNPDVSYPTWDASKYPRTQAERWEQLARAYALDPANAVASASYGLFQIMGFNHTACGFADPKAFVTDMCRSQAQQLKAFAAFVRSNNLADELVRKDWEGFARGYNGSGQVERYGGMMRDAYNALKASS